MAPHVHQLEVGREQQGVEADLLLGGNGVEALDDFGPDLLIEGVEIHLFQQGRVALGGQERLGGQILEQPELELQRVLVFLRALAQVFPRT